MRKGLFALAADMCYTLVLQQLFCIRKRLYFLSFFLQKIVLLIAGVGFWQPLAPKRFAQKETKCSHLSSFGFVQWESKQRIHAELFLLPQLDTANAPYFYGILTIEHTSVDAICRCMYVPLSLYPYGRMHLL